MKTIYSVLSVLSLLAVGACSNNNNSSPGQPGTQGITIVMPAGASTMGSTAFQPNPANVQPGATVTWRNDDNTAHHLMGDAGEFESGEIAPGQSFSWTAPAEISNNQVSYHCENHPNMVGTLIMNTPAPSPSPSASPTESPMSVP